MAIAEITPNAPETDTVWLPHSCRCGVRWAGMNTCHCAAQCHGLFSSPRAFEAHRRHGECLAPEAAGLVLIDRIGYRVRGFEVDAEALDRLRASRTDIAA